MLNHRLAPESFQELICQGASKDLKQDSTEFIPGNIHSNSISISCWSTSKKVFPLIKIKKIQQQLLELETRFLECQEALYAKRNSLRELLKSLEGACGRPAVMSGGSLWALRRPWSRPMTRHDCQECFHVTDSSLTTLTAGNPMERFPGTWLAGHDGQELIFDHMSGESWWRIQ